jgi:tetratricopeptide (TPR) repeat protein
MRGAHLLLLIGLAILAWQAVTFSLAIGSRKTDPVLAAKLAPNNALVLATLARSEFANDPAAAAATAKRALMRDATNAPAAGVLGLALARAGDAQHSMALLRYSQTMSRRDIPTQLWAIENAVLKGNIQEALHHYDIALRVGRSLPTNLFPVLAAAIEDPAIRGALAKLLGSDVPWKSSFLDYISANSVNIASASQLIDELYAAGGQVPAGPVRILIQRLIEANEVNRAWLLYARANPSAQRSGVRDGGFEATIDSPTVFDWQLEDRGDARAQILPGERGGELYIEARSGSGGVVARQRLVLAPTHNILAFTTRAGEGSTLGDSVVELFCMPSRQRVVQVRIAGVAPQSRRQGRFALPGNCASQSLEVTLYAGAAATTIEGSLDDVTIRPASPGGTVH